MRRYASSSTRNANVTEFVLKNGVMKHMDQICGMCEKDMRTFHREYFSRGPSYISLCDDCWTRMDVETRRIRQEIIQGMIFAAGQEKFIRRKADDGT
jgi:hypothetical protein